MQSEKPFEPRLSRNPDDAARYAGVGRTLIYEEIRRGKLKARKLGKRTLILDSDLNEWLKSLPLAAQPAA